MPPTIRFSLTPDTTDTFLSELGIAFLLDERIDRVQWIGQGLMPTYPGRFRAGRYGFWSLQKDDLYFEGNRRGVDAALLTGQDGGGILLFCQNGNVSFEQTDRGIVLTYNVAVSGRRSQVCPHSLSRDSKRSWYGYGRFLSLSRQRRCRSAVDPRSLRSSEDYPRSVPSFRDTIRYLSDAL